MRLLVLGPDGQLGHDLLRAATAAGHEVVGLPRTALDLTEGERIGPCLAGLDFDVLVNCAAYTRVDDAESDAATAMAVNGHAAAALAEACVARGARLVQISTDYVFDGQASRPYREDDPPAPLNVYGASKLVGEALARRAHPEGTLVVRTAALFGVAAVRRAETGGTGNFVETMIRLAREGGPLRVVHDILMSPTATADLAAGILTLLRAEPPAGTYHLANTGAASWYDFARAIVELATPGGGRVVEVEPVPAASYPTPACRPAFAVLDTGKARNVGCEMAPWREALERYVAQRRPGQ